MANAESTQRQIVLAAMQERPDDPWPRGAGHVVSGIPGGPVSQKAYHEPGGGFSPSPGSFGVSIWVQGRQGHRIATSDDMPLDAIHQRYVHPEVGGVPAIETVTPYYQCRWWLTAEDLWQFEVKESDPSQAQICMLVRSVGPAGGPIERLDWDHRQLIVNRRWVITFDRSAAGVHLADEDHRGWQTTRNDAASCDSQSGWAAARIEISHEGIFRLTIRDAAPRFASPLTYTGVKSALEMDLPDPAFADSLNAQAANLLMGFVGRQTCPGEPTNYPLAWERDGAYSLVAMARCGQVDTAKELAVYFAENDFFGGFGAEGDAPGSAINALVSVAVICEDPDFQQWVWPHIQRKADLIGEMLSATQPMRKPWVGPIVPYLRGKEELSILCGPARDDLIVGNMDHHYPVLYTSAMSFRGLQQAMRLAEILGKADHARHLPAMAERIRRAWLRHFDNPELRNERTFMSGLWPTWITGPAFAPYRKGLQDRWEKLHDQGRYPTRPRWTYFTVTEAHQWLFLDQLEHVWATLRYFWANQSSPGLYTYWEGDHEENTFERWQHIRGWVKPPHVTPHYWTAAEMLLLQIDMLAYVSEAGGEPVLVVGAGVPAQWLDHSMRVGGLPTSIGRVDWSYESGNLTVMLHGTRQYPIRPGPSMVKDIEVNVRYCP